VVKWWWMSYEAVAFIHIPYTKASWCLMKVLVICSISYVFGGGRNCNIGNREKMLYQVNKNNRYIAHDDTKMLSVYHANFK
jgi:hypothetical protein